MKSAISREIQKFSALITVELYDGKWSKISFCLGRQTFWETSGPVNKSFTAINSSRQKKETRRKRHPARNTKSSAKLFWKEIKTNAWAPKLQKIWFNSRTRKRKTIPSQYNCKTGITEAMKNIVAHEPKRLQYFPDAKFIRATMDHQQPQSNI